MESPSSPTFFPTARNRKRRPPLGAGSGFFAPVDLTGTLLIRALAALSTELLSFADSPNVPFQRRNARSLLRKVRLFQSLFDSLRDDADADANNNRSSLPPSIALCFRELYILLYRARVLLEYCAQPPGSSNRLWLILQNARLSAHFHDLTAELSTLLDVFPLATADLPLLRFAPDVREQVELLRRQTAGARLYVDPKDEALREKILSFLACFREGRVPDAADLREAFVERLGIRDARACRSEIEFLEEQIYTQEEAEEVDFALVDGVVALARYCRYALFGFEYGVDGRSSCMIPPPPIDRVTSSKSFGAIPKDFCCPISLDLMRDPVIVSTGQTYDRGSITRWMDEGHATCPNSGQALANKRLVPNRALRNLISQWCATRGIMFDPQENPDSPSSSAPCPTGSGAMPPLSAVPTVPTEAAVGANKATADLLVRQLDVGSDDAKTVAAQELRLLAKNGKESRAYIAEVGAIPHLRRLLSSIDYVAQENSVTALLNLSIYEPNKALVMEEPGCLMAIVDVLRNGLTTEARENAAATLFSLSAVHPYKLRISDEAGALEALAELLKKGTPRGKKDAVTALFNLSTYSMCSPRMLESGAVLALVHALEADGVAEEAAGALTLLVRQAVTARVVAIDHRGTAALVALIRRGTPKAKENAVAVLAEMCRAGSEVTEVVATTPALAGLVQSLLFSGTKRARRKAACLTRLFQRLEAASRAMPPVNPAAVPPVVWSGVGEVSDVSAFSMRARISVQAAF